MMLLRVGLGAVVTAVVEIWFMVWVAQHTDPTTTVLLLILLSAGGAWIVKREGLMALRRLQGNVRAGHFPTSDVVDGFLILAAGALLLPPGFITGALGLLLVIPPVRRLAGRFVSDAVRVRIAERLGPTRGPAGGPGWRADGWTADRGRGRGPDSPPSQPGDVLDVDGEEVDLFGGSAEIGPARRE
jgi:UPF0716 protein FxsA